MQTISNWYQANSESLLREIDRVRNCIIPIFGAGDGDIKFFSSRDRKSTYIS